MNRFSCPEEIPELVPEVLWIPEDRTDLHVPKLTLRTIRSTTPREVGYAFFTGSFSLPPERDILSLKEEAGESVVSLLTSEWGNHIGRVVIRAMCDPDRLANIDMLEVYRNELVLARFPNRGEDYFFENFVDYHGVLLDRQSLVEQ